MQSPAGVFGVNDRDTRKPDVVPIRQAVLRIRSP